MDAAQLATGFAIVAVGFALGRLVVGSAARASDGMTALFAAPDRSLGWPHGVQESDVPWGWRDPSRPPTGVADTLADTAEARTIDLGAIVVPRHGSFVVALVAVAPIRFAVRPL